MNKSNLKTLRRPLKIIVAYLLLTLFLYAFGPFQWVTYRPILFWLLNGTYIGMFILGWELGIKRPSRKTEWNDSDGKGILSFLRVAITIEFLFELMGALRRFQVGSFSFSQLMRKLSLGLSDMGGAYRSFQAAIDDPNAIAIGGTAVTMFNLFWCIFSFNVLMLGILYLKKLSRYNKIVLFLTIALIIAQYVATGTNIGVFRVILIFIVFAGINLSRRGNRFSLNKRKKRSKWFIVAVIVAIAAILTLFDKIMQSRGGILLWQSSGYNVGGIRIRSDSILLRILPAGLQMLFVAACAYLAQGYYGMSLCLRIPWKPGFGVGHSMALMDMFSNALATVHANSYQARVTQFGWQERIQWHTMYSWFANDVTFFGVIPIMMIIGYFFALAFKDSVETNNPYAKLVTVYFSLMAFFIPCNNQLFQSNYIWLGLVTALVLWLATRGKRRIVITFGGKRL